jgi:stage III sporulation protein AA
MRGGWKEEILPLLPSRLRAGVGLLDEARSQSIEELRVRVGHPIQARGGGWECFFGSRGPSQSPEGDLRVSPEECRQILGNLCRQSIYTIEEELRKGYLTLPGGSRVGLGGHMLQQEGQPLRLTHCTFFNFRISRQVLGCGREALGYLLKNGRLRSTLILSPPGCGKTTLLRDLARMLSEGEQGAAPHQVVILDERSEIAGSRDGVPGLKVGRRTDVIDGCGKKEALEMALRALSPQVIVMDELGGEEDARAILEACKTGAALLATAHGESIEALKSRAFLRSLCRMEIFERYVLLGRSRGPGTLEEVYDREMRPLLGRQGGGALHAVFPANAALRSVRP